jgi:hypothetical protein
MIFVQFGLMTTSLDPDKLNPVLVYAMVAVPFNTGSLDIFRLSGPQNGVQEPTVQIF